jgi:NCAIR mutase (PurE)-related protein
MWPREKGEKIMTDDTVFADPGRGRRTGLPEAVLALGKSESQLVNAVSKLLEHHPVMVTKLSGSQSELLADNFHNTIFNSRGRTATVGGTWDSGVGKCAVITAGSSDTPIAEEAASSLEYLGIEPVRAYDRGVAGMHRAREIIDQLENEPRTAVIVLAGMEGALPSVVASSLPQPVIAVPTSVGYGSNFDGLSSLLGMLNSCVPGITVVNIDNGFGAAAAVYKSMKAYS